MREKRADQQSFSKSFSLQNILVNKECHIIEMNLPPSLKKSCFHIKSDIPSNFHDSLSKKIKHWNPSKWVSCVLVLPTQDCLLVCWLPVRAMFLIKNSIHTWTSCLQINLVKYWQEIQISYTENPVCFPPPKLSDPKYGQPAIKISFGCLLLSVIPSLLEIRDNQRQPKTKLLLSN